jgi:hypothetical protein
LAESAARDTGTASRRRAKNPMTGRCMLYEGVSTRWEACRALTLAAARYATLLPDSLRISEATNSGSRNCTATLSADVYSVIGIAYLIMMRSNHKDGRPRLGDVECTSGSTIKYQLVKLGKKTISLAEGLT